MVSGPLNDAFNIVQPQVALWLQRELNAIFQMARDCTRKNIDIRIDDNLSSLHCYLEPKGDIVVIPSGLVTRLALIIEIFCRTEQPVGKNAIVYTLPHDEKTWQRFAKLNDPVAFEKIEKSQKAMPGHYAALFGLKHNCTAEDLKWWCDAFEIKDGNFPYNNALRDTYRFALLFFAMHEIMHAVLEHPRRLAVIKDQGATAGQILRTRKGLELEADCLALRNLLYYGLCCTSSFFKDINASDIRKTLGVAGEIYSVFRGVILALAMLDCGKWRSGEFEGGYYFHPSERFFFSAINSKAVLAAAGGTHVLLGGSMLAEWLREESWWFKRPRSPFEDVLPSMFDEDYSAKTGYWVAVDVLQEFGLRVSNFVVGVERRNRDARGPLMPFNISVMSDFDAESHKKMDDLMQETLDDEVLGNAIIIDNDTVSELVRSGTSNTSDTFF